MHRQEPTPPSRWWLVVAFVVVVILWAINYWWGIRLEAEATKIAASSGIASTGAPSGAAGQFGDQFGAVNSLFSGLAFVGLVYAILMQRYEIAIAKEELEKTKQLIDDQKKSLDIQNRQTKQQVFESTFFNMLNLLSNITDNIDILNSQGKIISGKDIFNVLMYRLNEVFSQIYIKGEDDNYQKFYDRFYNKYSHEIDHYFRVMYSILSFVDSADLENRNNFYTKILRSQLSDPEIAIIFYNGLSDVGRRKFKPLIEKYGLLKGLKDRYVLDMELKEQYEASAFGNASKRAS